MTTIENKNIQISDIKESKTNYANLLIECNNVIPEKGYTIQEMENRLRIKSILKDKEAKEFIFEDADFNNLKQLVINMTWGIAEQSLVDFVNYIKTKEPDKK